MMGSKDLSAQEKQSERRNGERHTCSYLAEIRLGSNFTIRTIVKDVSELGARILIADRDWLPRSFAIAIPELGITSHAQCRWRRRGYAGIEFVKSTPSNPDSAQN